MSILKSSLVSSLAAAAFVCSISTAHAFIPVCNNNADQEVAEACDNGPNIIADGCDDSCLVLTGWACSDPGGTSASSCHQIVCGDGIVDSPEECDSEEPCCSPSCAFVSSSTECRPAVNALCDIAENCTGSDDECPADALQPSCTNDDGVACTVAACEPDGDCVATETCVENCFGPGFYQNHSSTEKGGNNITQAIIDGAGGLFVCGHFITETDELEAGLSAAEQGLCVRTQGVQQRQLFRQLITASLNCAISEGSDCEQITSRFIDVSFDDCNDLCAGEPVVDGPTEEQCKDALECFNKGGTYANGECSKGTCDDDGTTLCEDDGDCVSDDCVRFADSCAGGSLCTEDLPDADASICFAKKGPASSPKICNVARHDECTIDDSYCYQACQGPDSCIEACNATPGCDPVTACSDAFPCFESCFFAPFPDTYDCGCEYSWATFCEAVTSDPSDFLQCLYFYPLAQGEGFCQECGLDPLSCAF